MTLSPNPTQKETPVPSTLYSPASAPEKKSAQRKCISPAPEPANRQKHKKTAPIRLNEKGRSEQARNSAKNNNSVPLAPTKRHR